MKKLTIITTVFVAFLSVQYLGAQPMAALHQSGQTTFFNGHEAFQQAYTAAEDGATIYLSGGSFLAPDSIAKTITVFGTGHHPEYSGATGQTAVSGNIHLHPGSDNSHFEGIHFQNALEFGRNRQINNLVFRRCRVDGRIMSEDWGTDNVNHIHNMLITECVLAYASNHNLNNFRDLTITNSIISGNLYRSKFLTLSNSVLLSTSTNVLWMMENSTVQNCIIASSLSNRATFSDNRLLNNVLFNVESTINWGPSNVHSNNYYSVGRDNFFIDQEGALFSYTDDYNLQSPGQYPGADGTQVGIYGGMHPFKEGSVPMIPHVVRKSISHSIDADGMLQVEIEVSAQDH